MVSTTSLYLQSACCITITMTLCNHNYDIVHDAFYYALSPWQDPSSNRSLHQRSLIPKHRQFAYWPVFVKLHVTSCYFRTLPFSNNRSCFFPLHSTLPFSNNRSCFFPLQSTLPFSNNRSLLFPLQSTLPFSNNRSCFFPHKALYPFRIIVVVSSHTKHSTLFSNNRSLFFPLQSTLPFSNDRPFRTTVVVSSRHYKAQSSCTPAWYVLMSHAFYMWRSFDRY